jgi:hypothetical protein
MDERPVITTSMFILLKWQELHSFSFSGRRLGKQAGLFCFVQEWKGMKGMQGKGMDGWDIGRTSLCHCLFLLFLMLRTAAFVRQNSVPTHGQRRTELGGPKGNQVPDRMSIGTPARCTTL